MKADCNDKVKYECLVNGSQRQFRMRCVVVHVGVRNLHYSLRTWLTSQHYCSKHSLIAVPISFHYNTTLLVFKTTFQQIVTGGFPPLLSKSLIWERVVRKSRKYKFADT